MYTQSITRSRRTAFFLAIDCSGSMAEPIRFRGRPTTKAEAVASVANGLLFELIERARRSDGVRNYYDIAVLGYSGDDEGFIAAPRRPRHAVRHGGWRPCGPTSGARRSNAACPTEASPCANCPYRSGSNPAPRDRRPCAKRCGASATSRRRGAPTPPHAESFPPIVFNITDGEATDCDEEEAARRGRGDQSAPHGRRQRAGGEHPHRRGGHLRSVVLPLGGGAALPEPLRGAALRLFERHARRLRRGDPRGERAGRRPPSGA